MSVQWTFKGRTAAGHPYLEGAIGSTKIGEIIWFEDKYGSRYAWALEEHVTSTMPLSVQESLGGPNMTLEDMLQMVEFAASYWVGFTKGNTAIEDALRAEAEEDDLSDPRFDQAGRVHDWRNYIGTKTREVWGTLTAEQRRAIADDAQAAADREEWD